MPRKDQQEQDPTDEQDVLEGGPVTDLPQDDETEEQSSAASEQVTVKINGRTFRVNPEMAEALAEREDSFNRRFSEQGRELGELRRTVQSITDRRETPKDEPDPDIEFYSAPSKAVEKRLQTERETLKTEIREEYRAERARERFWEAFYSENKDLVGKEVVVNAVLAAEWETLKEGTGIAGRQALANAVRQVLGGESREPKTRKVLKNQPAHTERPSSDTRDQGAPPETGAPTSLSEILRRRAAARRAARKK